MPLVSVVLPTYNRKNTLRRAIDSVLAQTFADFELIVVDDGSTDGTREGLEGIDPRLRVVAQENRGVSGARNRGMAEGKGELIAFIDSDDEWLPEWLALVTAFFAAHPRETLLCSELWEDFGDGSGYFKHWRPEIGSWYPEDARRMGLHAFDAPAPQDDVYLRVYQERAPIGAWGAALAARAGHPGAFHYRGNIFESWRWGWLMAMQVCAFRRRAVEECGLLDERYRVAACFGYLARLCQRYTANFLGLPGCIKHERGVGGGPLGADHLVKGSTALAFREDMLRWHDELFCRPRPDDVELAVIRSFRHLYAARMAVERGQREAALAHLAEAEQRYRTAGTVALRWYATLLPAVAAAPAYRLVRRGAAALGRLRQRLSGA